MHYSLNNAGHSASYISKFCFNFQQYARLLVGHFVFISWLHSLFALGYFAG